MSDLKPDRCVHKALLSSRCRLVGEYNNPNEPDLFVTHGWQLGPEMNRNLRESAFSQNFFVATFRTTPIIADKPLIRLPEYSYFAEQLALYFSVLYGKLFKSHGLIETNGHFRIPSDIQMPPTNLYTLPQFNHSPRRCAPVTLNLCEISRIWPLLKEKDSESNLERILFTAARFYCHALNDIELQPELAYVNFVTCGEVISNSEFISDIDLYDDHLKNIFSAIETELKDGPHVVKTIKSRLYQVRRRFSYVLKSMLDDYFFKHHESKEDIFALKRETIEQSLMAAYDLRSLYSHTGILFGGHACAHPGYQNEVAIGQPILPNPDLVKALVRAPTLLGLERIMRYALLRIANEVGAILDGIYEGV